MCWKRPRLTPYHVIRIFSCLAHFTFFIFFKHTKHIVIFTNSGNIPILNQALYCLSWICYLNLVIYVFIPHCLHLIAMVCNGLLQLCCLPVMLPLYPSDFKLMIFFHLVGQLWSNMWIHQIIAMLPIWLSLILMTSKNQFAQAFLTDMNIAFLWISGPFDWHKCGTYTAILLFRVTFFRWRWAVIPFAVFVVFTSSSNALQASLARVQTFSLVVTTHKFFCVKYKWHRCRYL